MRTPRFLAGSALVAVIAMAAPAAATTPPSGTGGATPTGVVATPEQIASIVQGVDAPNNFCALAGVYYRVLFGAGGAGGPDSSAAVTPLLGRVTPVLSALANDIVANPPAGLPDVYHGIATQWVGLFGRTVDQLKGQGITDEQLVAILNAFPDGEPDGIDSATYDAAVATITTDVAAEFEATVEGVSEKEPDGFSMETYCPNVADVLENLDTTDPGTLMRMFRAPNSFCAMSQLYVTAALFTLFGSGEDAKQQIAAFAPALAALALDTKTSPPDGLPASVGPFVDTTAEVMGKVVAELRAAGLTDDDLKSMLQTVLQSSGDDTDGTVVTSPDAQRVHDAIAKVTVDLEAQLKKLDSSSDAEKAELRAFCPNVGASFAGES